MKSGPFAFEKLEFRVRDSTEAMVQARLRVLGRFSLELGDITMPSLATRKARAVLAYLVARRESDVAREKLLDLFWPEAPPAAAKDGLRSTLWSIRRSIKDAGFDPSAYLIANRAVVRWKARSWLDTEAFQELAQSDDTVDLEACLDLYKGDFLEGDYEEWTIGERSHLDATYERVLERLVRVARSHEAAQTLLNRNPYDEPSYLLLIENELVAGRIVAAAALAERCQRALSEIGAQASERLRQLTKRISAHQAQTVARPELPFVGRDAELATIRNCLIKQNDARAFLVYGEAGIGKSALLSHAEDLAEHLGRSIIRIRCFVGDARPFGPFEGLYDKLLDHVTRAGVLSIDDAHAMQADARKVLSKLATRVCEHGGVLLIAARIEGVPDITAACAGVPLESIPLGPLSLEDLRSAVDSVSSSDVDLIAQTLFERSGGHPFFAATLLDSLVQAGILRTEQGAWRFVRTLDERVALPKTLATYIQTRLNARGQFASTLAAALALEPAATPDDLVAVLQSNEEQVSRAIDDLLSMGVLTQRLSAPHLSFAHDLYREVAATMLNPAKRIRLHRSFAQHFASLSGPEGSLRSARHLSLAGDISGAAQAYSHASEAALESGAALEARDRCDAGIALLAKLEHAGKTDRIMAQLKMLSAQASSALGDSASAIAVAGEAIAFARRIDDRDVAIQASVVRQRAFLDTYDVDAVLASARDLTAMAAPHDQAALAIARSDESWAQRVLGRGAEAAQASFDAVTIASSISNSDLLCYALVEQVLVGATWWNFVHAAQAATRAKDIVMSASRTTQIALYTAIAYLNLALGKLGGAAEAISSARALLQIPVDVQGLSVSRYSQTRLNFQLESAAARLALVQGDNDAALASAANLDKMASHQARCLGLLFRTEACFELGRAAIPDAITQANSATLFFQDVCSGSRSPEIERMLTAVSVSAPDASELVLRSLDRVEAAARRVPLEADRAFAQVARAAERRGLETVAVRAQLRSDDYRETRERAAMGVADL